ncbi:hypothetical protein LJK88_13015 [Paenibacillus sp. P26]|nr:hypothetical protein LJK88_13015 [Paenibacillus sp. P26]
MQPWSRSRRLLEELEPLPVRSLPACGDWGLLLQTRRMEEDKVLIFISNQEAEPREVESAAGAAFMGGKQRGAPGLAFRELSMDTGEVLRLDEARRMGESWALPRGWRRTRPASLRQYVLQT